MEYTLLKLAAIVSFFTVILPIFKFYMQQKIKDQKKHEEKEIDNFNQLKAIKDIYLKERKPLYLQAWREFNALCKQGRMHKEDAVLLSQLIEEMLGSYADEYKGYKFKNEYNRIYVLMKNWHIDDKQWKIIINFLYEVDEAE